VGRKKIYDETLLVNNPFVESPDFALNVRSFLNKEQYVNVKDISDGVITALPNTITTKFLIEQEPYVKVYNRKGYYLHVATLAHTTKSLYLYILYHLQQGKDYIHLNPAKVMEQIMVKDITTYRKCLQDLTIHMFVTPTLCEDVFWINPVFFFNGSRIEKYKHKIVEV
jgi:hypothetical protein